MYGEPTVKWRKAGLKYNGLQQKEERNIQPEQNEETRTEKHEERLRDLQGIFKRSNVLAALSKS